LSRLHSPGNGLIHFGHGLSRLTGFVQATKDLIHRARGRPHNGFDFTLHDEHNPIAGVKAQSISDGLRNSNLTFACQ
jgi:hypothetical protein